MNTTTLQTIARGFFTLRPTRNPNVSTHTAIKGAAFVVLTQLTDFSSTVYGLSQGATEANGIMASLLAQHGVPGFAIVKALGAILLVWITYRRQRAPWVVGSIYAIVTLWNIAVITWL
jgi:hypothetical protein